VGHHERVDRLRREACLSTAAQAGVITSPASEPVSCLADEL
jgi:hypothetical protein